MEGLDSDVVEELKQSELTKGPDAGLDELVDQIDQGIDSILVVGLVDLWYS